MQGYIVKTTNDKLLNEISGKERNMYESFWIIRVVPSTQFLTWEMLQSRTGTKDNLCRWGILLKSKLCVMCGEKEESTIITYFLVVKFPRWFGICVLIGLVR